MEQINHAIKHNTWAIILAAIVFSFLSPQLGLYLKPFLGCLLMTLMFLSCLDLKIREIVDSLSDFHYHLIALLIVHLASPILILFLKGYFPDPIFLGLIIAATIPAGRSAVFLSNIYGGIPVKALVVSSLSNIFSPITVPLLVWIFAQTSIKVNPTEISTAIIYLVIIPLLLAIMIGKTNFGKKLNNYSASLSVIILFLIIVGIISPVKDVVFQNPVLTVILSVLITVLVIIDFTLGYLLGHNHSENITYAISSSYKNYTLATLLSLSLFTPLVALPAIIYTVISNVLLIPLQIIICKKTVRSKLTSNHHHLHRHRKHKNISLFIIGLIAVILFSRSQIFQSLVLALTAYPLLSAFIAGIMFTSTFTIAAGGLIIISLVQSTSPILLILIGGLGAVFCDFLIYYFFKDKISNEISPIYNEIISKNHLKKIMHTRIFAWTLPVIGAIVIASPLPDELGVSLMGFSDMKAIQFFLISFGSHLIGMSSLVIGAKLF